MEQKKRFESDRLDMALQYGFIGLNPLVNKTDLDDNNRYPDSMFPRCILAFASDESFF